MLRKVAVPKATCPYSDPPKAGQGKLLNRKGSYIENIDVLDEDIALMTMKTINIGHSE